MLEVDGIGHVTASDTHYALAEHARARERRRIGREECCDQPTRTTRARRRATATGARRRTRLRTGRRCRMSENTVVVLGADERALRRLAELLAPYMPAPAPAASAEPDRWMNSREAAEYAGTTLHALHKAMAAREVHFEQDCPRRQGVVQARGHRRVAARRAAGVEAEAGGMSGAEAAAAVAARQGRQAQAARRGARQPGRLLAPGRHCSRSATATPTAGSAGAVRSRRSPRRARRADDAQAQGARRRAGVGEPAAEVRRGGRPVARRAGRRAAAGDAGELPDRTSRTTCGRAGAIGAWTRSTSPTPRAWCASCARTGSREWTIAGVLHVPRTGCSSSRAGTAAGAARTRSSCWRRASGRRSSATPERRIYTGDELAQMLAASSEPWTTLFRLAERTSAAARASCSGCGGRTSTCATWTRRRSASRTRSTARASGSS